MEISLNFLLIVKRSCYFIFDKGEGVSDSIATVEQVYLCAEVVLFNVFYSWQVGFEVYCFHP
mgnify:CR=1 FL=1